MKAIMGSMPLSVRPPLSTWIFYYQWWKYDSSKYVQTVAIFEADGSFYGNMLW